VLFIVVGGVCRPAGIAAQHNGFVLAIFKLAATYLKATGSVLAGAHSEPARMVRWGGEGTDCFLAALVITSCIVWVQ
jgi:hypothetical protein